MTAGRDLVGETAGAARGRGRPKGSRNRRTKDLASYLDVTCGGTAALQLAKECMVTVAEVRKAGTAEAAVMAKAGRAVEAHEAEAHRLGEGFRDVVRDELARLIEAERIGADLAKRVGAMAERLELAAQRFTLTQALARIDDGRKAILPYTDQKQPMIVATPAGQAPVMVLVGGSPDALAQQNQGVIEGDFVDVTPPSHTARE